MEHLEIQAIEAEVAVKRILTQKNGGAILITEILNDLHEREREIEMRESNLQMIIRNIKPEYLEEMKKLINEDIFNSLGL